MGAGVYRGEYGSAPESQLIYWSVRTLLTKKAGRLTLFSLPFFVSAYCLRPCPICCCLIQNFFNQGAKQTRGFRRTLGLMTPSGEGNLLRRLEQLGGRTGCSGSSCSVPWK